MHYLADIIKKHYLSTLSPVKQVKTTWLVPSYETGKLINSLVAKIAKRTEWAPLIMTPSDWLQKLSGCTIPSHFELLVKLYTITQKQEDSLSFSQFMEWGSTLLQDFKQLDSTVIDVGPFFKTPPILEQELNREHSSSLLNQFSKVWSSIPTIYHDYRKLLLQEKHGYQGLVARELYEQLKNRKITYSGGPIVAINLHPIPLVLQKILRFLSQEVDVNCYYDVDSYYMEDKNQSAGYHLRAYAQDPVLGRHLAQPYPTTITTNPPTIELIATTTPLEQIVALNKVLQTLIAQGKLTKQLDQVAIVLGDEALLTPLLQSLPASLSPVNLLTGYPLAATPLYRLSKLILQFYYASQEQHDKQVINLTEKILNHTTIMLDASQFTTWQQALPTVTPWKFLETFLKSMQDPDQKIAHLAHWEKIVVDHLLASMKELMIVPRSDLLPQKEALQIFNKVMQHKKMPLHHPKKGIKITRFTNTIDLTAQWVFVLGAQEGLMPPSLPATSLFPRSWREKNGYPSVAAQEAPYAYLFYQLLQKTNHLYFFYATGQKGASMQEKSRYLSQLIYQSPLTVVQKTHPPGAVERANVTPPTILKSKAIQQALQQFLATGNSRSPLTPSALNAYLDCPLCFYFQYIAHIPPATIAREDNVIDPLHFGQIFHQVMEQLYRPYVNYTMNHSTLLQLEAAVLPTIEAVLDQLAEQPAKSNPLMREVVLRLVKKVIEKDQSYAPFTLLGVEIGKKGTLSALYPLSDGRQVVIGGVIDRVDCKGDTMRVIDYKTGSWQPTIPNMNCLFNALDRNRNKIAMQLMTYSWLYRENNLFPTKRVMPMVISSRTLFTSLSSDHFVWKPTKEKAVPINDIQPYQDSFKEALGKILEELFDPDIPFRASPSSLHPQVHRYPTLCRGQSKS